ncbi:hypothetical protein KVR01_005276 [Diaporthe batatas]|uniref:uncharacterized protein n=1 Tax=Diaporthe batatas TaxID=748121 RepID=UPI001D03B92E|nr:uncharacterized protein KVR01_005276 [Diaporthe batatas]KAG8165001.1 hypothetical protein KVR01_005276 [Diaporthe batatas]
MGALCGKESRDDNFAGPGRRLDSSPDQSPTAPLPSNKRVVGGPPRTLGGSSSGGGGASSSSAADARRKAAEAAEARQKAAEGKFSGKLGSQLQQQKKEPLNETMKRHADEERQRREIERNDEQRNYN